MALADARISTVLWAAGGCWDFGWVDLPVFDDRISSPGPGVTVSPGHYLLGPSFVSRAKPGLFPGADASGWPRSQQPLRCSTG